MPKEWTLASLKEHFDTRFNALKEAVDKADDAYEKRMDTTNEWRAALTDQQKTFVTKEQARWAFGSFLSAIAIAVAVYTAITGGEIQ